mmetsp:Transcript_52014/g.111314  ORF Transcript_52014/g.111314 Transcript_52014/m.111314 type:complete len:158 (+) Transcript_52014:68-541(+)
MGLKFEELLSFGTVLVSVLGTLRGLQHFPALPQGVEIPLKFGLFGEVINSVRSKCAYLLYPGCCILCGLSPALVHARKQEAPDWVTNKEAYQSISRRFYDVTMLLSSVLLTVITEQVPAIVRKEQRGLRPDGIVAYYMAAMGVGFGGYAWAIRRFAC